MKIANNINEKYDTPIEEKCDLSIITKEFNNAIAAARKIQESEDTRNIVYNSEYMMVEKPGEEDIYVTHIF